MKRCSLEYCHKMMMKYVHTRKDSQCTLSYSHLLPFWVWPISMSWSIWKEYQAAESLFRDLRLWQKDSHLCSYHQSDLYGWVTRQKSVWSKKHMTACWESLPNEPCSSEDVGKTYFFVCEEKKKGWSFWSGCQILLTGVRTKTFKENRHRSSSSGKKFEF